MRRSNGVVLSSSLGKGIPLEVFVSSAIGEFLPYRTVLKETLAGSPFARFWVFEWETAASDLVPRYLLRAALFAF